MESDITTTSGSDIDLSDAEPMPAEHIKEELMYESIQLKKSGLSRQVKVEPHRTMQSMIKRWINSKQKESRKDSNPLSKLLNCRIASDEILDVEPDRLALPGQVARINIVFPRRHS